MVAPASPGESVEIQRQDESSWRIIKTVPLNRESVYNYRWRSGPDKGAFVFRVFKPPGRAGRSGC